MKRRGNFFPQRGEEARRIKRVKIKLPVFSIEGKSLRLICELGSEIGR